jgi:hypothetical protein
MIELGLKRRDHADDECARRDLQALAHFCARGEIGLEACCVDTRRYADMTALGKTGAAVMSGGRLGGIDDLRCARCRLRCELELVPVDQARRLRQRQRVAHTEDDVRLPVASLTHERREDLRGVPPGLNHIGTKCAHCTENVFERGEREAASRECDVVHRYALQTQHIRAHASRR